MMFLFEEIAVEGAMILATLAATACLLVVVLGFVLKYRAQRTGAYTADAAAPDRLVAERAGRQRSTFTPTHN